MTSRQLVDLFQELFPRLVIEKWLPVKESSVPTIKVVTTEKQYYLFKCLDATAWSLTRCRLGFKNGID